MGRGCPARGIVGPPGRWRTPLGTSSSACSREVRLPPLLAPGRRKWAPPRVPGDRGEGAAGGRGSRAGVALEAEATLLGPVAARLFELLGALVAGVLVPPEPTGFAGIPGPGAAGGPGTLGDCRRWGPAGELIRQKFKNPRRFSWAEFPGLCPEYSVFAVARRAPGLLSENTYIKEANFRFVDNLCCRKRSEEKLPVALTGKPKREAEVDSTEDAVLGKKPKLEDISEDAK